VRSRGFLRVGYPVAGARLESRVARLTYYASAGRGRESNDRALPKRRLETSGLNMRGHSRVPTSLVAAEAVVRYCSIAPTLRILHCFGSSRTRCFGWLLENKLVRQYILALMFHSWDGLASTNNSGWLSADEECSWLGITCNDEGRVIRVDLPNSTLSGIMPSRMHKLQDLQVINLSGNLGLRGPLPSSSNRLSSL
jgi:hypothetical protein